jgi:hypothetical protein
MAKRKGWSALTQPVRRRYELAGITATSYGEGASLDKARGHYTPYYKSYVHPPRGPRPPKVALDKLVNGVANTKERRAVEKWYETDAPKWLRSTNLGADTAAQIFMANLRPENWESVDMYVQRDGSVIAYIESTRGGPRRKITFADTDAAREVERYLDDVEFEGEREWHDSECSPKSKDRNYTPRGKKK